MQDICSPYITATTTMPYHTIILLQITRHISHSLPLPPLELLEPLSPFFFDCLFTSTFPPQEAHREVEKNVTRLSYCSLYFSFFVPPYLNYTHGYSLPQLLHGCTRHVGCSDLKECTLGSKQDPIDHQSGSKGEATQDEGQVIFPCSAYDKPKTTSLFLSAVHADKKKPNVLL
ncbi:hypothetical protein BC939DRAFT_41338 [Gamsiella multidivaricata]|uniref:uncharacterized protein n=1 Tax=Gamsiella multidivaricata TaxID=101098 RepID=UPI002220861F|nr:uncharacterized protein BC939DRAFT_41338 [Gamsiella multidivaricata]KAI7816533.1 hypothetical protein BC939DRAFT_41338 [Gamsiella multidivaricata]